MLYKLYSLLHYIPITIVNESRNKFAPFYTETQTIFTNKK